MARYTLSDDCPCAYELFPQSRRLARKYRRESGHESVLFHIDWDYPSLAGALGWNMRALQAKRGAQCDHSGTDGTVDCACGVTAGMFIEAAGEWLSEHVGRGFNDPHGVIAGYFGW